MTRGNSSNPSLHLTRRQFGVGAGAAGAGLLAPQFAQADTYPSRTVTIVAR